MRGLHHRALPRSVSDAGQVQDQDRQEQVLGEGVFGGVRVPDAITRSREDA